MTMLELKTKPQLIELVKDLESELAIVRAQLVLVTGSYRRDMMREMRSGFDVDEFEERLTGLMKGAEG
jgi:hypothetical protein